MTIYIKYPIISALLVVACSTVHSNTEHNICQQSASLSSNQFVGTSLGDKQLALTFDDGPGSRTLELSSYLKSQGIAVAFFINGHCFSNDNTCGNRLSSNDTFDQVISDGHMVGNHTQNHNDLTSYPIGIQGDTSIIKELSDTDNIIINYIDNNHFLFRPPYGNWDDRNFYLLQNSNMNKYVGPIRWDIGGSETGEFGADWDCWQNKNGLGVKTSDQCATLYLNEIRLINHGIVLMHDSDMINSDIGNTVDMIKILIPILKAEGYSFVRVDGVPDIAAALNYIPPPVPPPPPTPPPPPPPPPPPEPTPTPPPEPTPAPPPTENKDAGAIDASSDAPYTNDASFDINKNYPPKSNVFTPSSSIREPYNPVSNCK